MTTPTMRPPKRGVSYSEAITAAYASNPEDEVALDTLEFLHPTFRDEDGDLIGLRVVNDHSLLLACLEATAPLDASSYVDFRPVSFEFTRPPETESAQLNEVALKVDNVARILIPYLDAAKESRVPITMIWRPYLPSDLSGPHIDPVLSLTLRGVGGDMNSMTARAGFSDLTNRRYPASEYTSRKFPGLFVR